MINNHKTQGEWKIHLTMAISFCYSEEIRTMHSKNDNIEITIGSETDEIIVSCHNNPEKSSTTKINKHTYNIWLFIVYKMFI